jgi:hypothetical protein
MFGSNGLKILLLQALGLNKMVFIVQLAKMNKTLSPWDSFI